MSLVTRFTESIKKDQLFSSKDRLLLAVSGGVDSVVLCELCKQAGYDFVIAHCNFQLRGEESERDEAFVRSLSQKYETEVLVKKFETEKYAADNKLSIQEAARGLRYNWFAELVNPQSAMANLKYLLTAHHADDNIETILMNFCRGTGLHGLTGIPAINSFIRRPLLNFFKAELIHFAKENDLAYAEDSSNESSKYTRNLFRNEIIPLIATAYSQVKENLHDNINRFKEIEKLYQLSVETIRKKLCKQKGSELHIPVKQLMAHNNRALIYEIISDYGFNEKQVDEVIKLAASESGRYIESPDHTFQLIRHRHWFIISPVKSAVADNIIIEENDTDIQFAGGDLHLEMIQTSNSKPETSNLIALLDAKEIQFPLLLRKWKAGDYFYPLGMRKKKKLARFFIDQKISKTGKENIWVIEMNQKIIWVVGQRIDDRFKLTPSSGKLLRLKIS